MIARDRTVDVVARERFVDLRVVAARASAAPLLLSVCPCGAPSHVLTEGVFASKTPRIAPHLAPHLDSDGDLCAYRYCFVPAPLRGAL